MTRLFVAGLPWFIVAATAAAPATQPAAEAKLVRDLYGRRIEQALVTSDTSDNVTLTRELLVAAADSASPALLRHLLAMQAVKLGTPVGTTEAAKLARQALALADRLRPLKPTWKWQLRLNIARQCHEVARKAGASKETLSPLAEALTQDEIGLARAMMREQDLDRAYGILIAARGRAKALGLPATEAEADAAMQELKAYRLRLNRIRLAEAQLRRATQANDDDDVKVARQKLALIYLLDDGDLAKAHSYLAGSGHAYEAPVKAAVAFSAKPHRLPPPAACNQVVESLAAAAKKAANRAARVSIATAGMNLCRAFLATNPQGLPATKARLLLLQVERLAEDSPAHRLIRRLKANYGSLDAKIEVLQDGVVRFSYDFSDPKQRGDWTETEGRWQVSRVRNKHILVATCPNQSRARLENRLRFRPDKPLSLSFRVSGQRTLAGLLIFIRDISSRSLRSYIEFELGALHNTCSRLCDYGSTVWSDARVKIVPNRVYRVEITWDGARTVTWTVNGKLLCKHKLQYLRRGVADFKLSVGLQTLRHDAGFDDVKVEGVVIEDPGEKPSSSSGSGWPVP